MASSAKHHPVVAELGRPETPAETAERKAESSRTYRASKTMNNLWFSVIVTVGLVLVIVLIVPRDDSPRTQNVDYSQIATEAQQSFPVPLADPQLPASWISNGAELRTQTTDGVEAWYLGLITPSKQYLGLLQGVDANPSWLVEQVDQTRPSDTVTIDGIPWTVYDNRGSSADVGNVKYALSAEAGRSTFVIYGTTTPEETAELASAISSTVRDQQQGASE